MTVIKVELDNENGALVYSVELSNGADVKIDAGSAALLYTDSGGEKREGVGALRRPSMGLLERRGRKPNNLR